MRERKPSALFLLGLLFAMVPASLAATPPVNSDITNGWEGSRTFRMVESYEEMQASRATNASQLNSEIGRGNERAKAVLNMLREIELQKPREELAKKGELILQQNPDARTPVAIIGVGASLWLGRDLPITNSEDFKLSSRFEGRAKSGSLDMASTVLNGQVRVGGDGVNVGLNRAIEPIRSRANIFYNVRNRILSTQIVHTLFNHVDLSVGASRAAISAAEGTAGLLYSLTF